MEDLELNILSHYGETPFDLAIEHRQTEAVRFALEFNQRKLQSYLNSADDALGSISGYKPYNSVFNHKTPMT